MLMLMLRLNDDTIADVDDADNAVADYVVDVNADVVTVADYAVPAAVFVVPDPDPDDDDGGGAGDDADAVPC